MSDIKDYDNLLAYLQAHREKMRRRTNDFDPVYEALELLTVKLLDLERRAVGLPEVKDKKSWL